MNDCPSSGDLLITVKSREVQRGLLAELRDETAAARRHFLAAAHLELVLAEGYEQDGKPELAFRSRLSAASCLWHGGEMDRAQEQLDVLAEDQPNRATEIHGIIGELESSNTA